MGMTERLAPENAQFLLNTTHWLDDLVMPSEPLRDASGRVRIRLRENPVRVRVAHPRYPPDAGPVVAVDASHYNSASLQRGYEIFGELLQADGYRVVPLGQPLTKARLAGCDVFVIGNALHAKSFQAPERADLSAFTDEEIAVLSAWVDGGGSLLVQAGRPPYAGAAARLAAAFGFIFRNRAVVYDETETITFEVGANAGPKDHPIFRGRKPTESISQVRTFGGAAFVPPRDATALLRLGAGCELVRWKNYADEGDARLAAPGGLAQGAVMRCGKGRVGVFGAPNMFEVEGRIGAPAHGMQTSEAAGNAQFLLNLLHWLTQTH
jgi:hypothetical protein